MLKFIPIPGAPYKHDYIDIFRTIAHSAGRVPEIPTYRGLCKIDLFFLMYFGLNREDINQEPKGVDKGFLIRAIRDIEDDHVDTLDLYAREHYKALCNQTPVPTPSGWKEHGDLKPGDIVFSPSGLPVVVLARTSEFYNADCYEIEFSDGEKIIASGGHLWDVNFFNRQRAPGTKNECKGWEVRRFNTCQVLEYTNYQQGLRHPYYLSIDYNKPLLLPKADLPVEPYTLGCWLGDGDNKAGRITNVRNEIWENIERDGYEIGNDQALIRDDTQTRTVYGISSVLRNMGLLENKHIPLAYLRSSISQRTALLQGLMDTDGSVSQRGDLVFVTKYKQLAHGVAGLIRTLGMRANVQYYKYYMASVQCDYPYWRVAYRARPDFEPFRLKYHKDRLSPHRDKDWHGRKHIHNVNPVPSVPCRCIQVEGGSYLAGEYYTATRNSSILTFGLPIQELIINPEERIGIFSHTRPIAKGFLRQIKLVLEDALPVKKWFPDVFYNKPKSQAPKWSEDDGLYVKRKTHPKEASVEAWGVIDSMPTGKHFTIRIYDDLVTPEGVTTPEMIRKVADAYELSQSLGTDGGTKRLAGTHYHFSDLYATLRKKPSYKVRIKPATDDGTPTGQPVFLSQQRLNELLAEQGAYIFSCQQLLSPVAAGDQKFRVEWLKYYDALPEKLNVYMLCDPANEKRKKSDYTTLCAIGIDQYENYYLMQILRDKLNLDERWVALKNMYISLHKMGYPPQSVGYEKYGKDSDIFYFEKCQQREGLYFPIIELGGRTGKWDRIMNMVPFFEKGRFLMPNRYYYTPQYCDVPGMEGKPVDMVKVFIDEEYCPAPYCVHDDMFDCISRIQESKLGVTAPMLNRSNMIPGGGPMPGAAIGASGWMVG